MPEPTSSGVAGAAVAYKALGGSAAAAASGATLAAVVGPVFDKIAASLVDAFVKRAEQVYGTESA